MTRKAFIAAAAALLICQTATARKTSSPSVLDLKHSISDSSIVYPESFERDAQRLLDGWYMRNYTSLDPNAPDPGNTDVGDDEMRSSLLALPTVIEMPFNQIVRSYIDRYVENSRPQVSAILGLGSYYFPIFEQALEERGLPHELKYLPVIESGLDPNAVSKHGAAGLWQFMLATAKGLGMEVNSLVDERRDPYLSSALAADYLKSLHDTYGDWNLAIAAYNCGPNNINKAIRRAGGDPAKKDFWSIYEYLTPETRGYVPMFIAANYVMNFHGRHGIAPVLPTKPLVTDTLHISDRVHFNQISAVLDIPVDELRILNPQYRADVVPGSAEKQYTVILPSRQTQAFIMSKDEILAYESEKYSRRDSAEPGDDASEGREPEIVTSLLPLAGKPETAQADVQMLAASGQQSSGTTLTHKVQKGETLASIASKYGVAASQIRAWNHLRRNNVRTGQTLKIMGVPEETASKSLAPLREESPASTQRTPLTASASKAKGKKEKAQWATRQTAPKTTDHTIKSGESLTSISKKYGVTIDELRAANGMKGDNLRAGNTLKIPSKGKGAAKSKGKSAGKSKKSKKRRR